MFGGFVLGAWALGIVLWTLKNTRRSRDHQPRAVRLLEAPKCELTIVRGKGEYTRPAPTSLPGPAEPRRG